jgi:hypothetical protein
MFPVFGRQDFEDLPDPVKLKDWKLFRGGNSSEDDS